MMKSRKQSRHRWILFISLAGLGLAWLMTYGRWEFLSQKYAKEFIQPIYNDTEKGCLLDYPKLLKVMNYTDSKAQVFMKASNKSTFLVDFTKNGGSWTMREKINDTQWVCNFTVINSRTGGSAKGIYWYN